MWIAHDYRVARRSAGTAVAIGNFDGVHRGHREILRRVIEGARAHAVDPVVLTFEPHPTRILAPERASALLTGLDRKLELVADAGIVCTVVQMFDRRFSAQTPREFAREVLLGLRAREVYIGADFHFGKDRAGNGQVLAELGREMGFVAHGVEPVVYDGETISSTRVRRALADGDLATANELLGRRFDIDGLVVEGDRRGRLLGFPTANIRTQVEALPRDGVYAVRVRVLGAENEPWTNGVMNIGVRPTFAAGRSIEVHLLDTQRELYGATLRVECVARLRDERKFEGIDALRTQIERDVAEARRVLLSEGS
jgi:riboflavin kinase/FMN adenylyltransferase